ncbi:MAG: hypothetical protein AAF557_27220 [Pseudomonadota bacterium]
MSNDNRKSMDDVLASIRRIVRAEKSPDDAETVEGLEDDGPMPQEVLPGSDEAPLELTPDMQMGDSANAAAAAVVPPRMDTPTMDDDQIKALIREVVSDEIANGDMNGIVRNVIRDELTTGEIGGNISRNVLALIKSEIAKSAKS